MSAANDAMRLSRTMANGLAKTERKARQRGHGIAGRALATLAEVWDEIAANLEREEFVEEVRRPVWRTGALRAVPRGFHEEAPLP